MTKVGAKVAVDSGLDRRHGLELASTQLAWRPLVRTDLLELFGLLTAIELHDDPSERYSLDSLYEHYDTAGAAPTENALVGWAGETPIAYGWNCVGLYDTDPRRVWLIGGVHPGWRRLGHGRRLMEWQLTRAREWDTQTREDRTRSSDAFGPLQVIGNVDALQADRNRLFRRYGFDAVRWYADMSRPLDGALPPVELPTGFEIVGYAPTMSEPVRLAHNAAFADHWGSQPVATQAWRTDYARSSFRADWSFVVRTEAGQVAGYAMSSAYQQDWDASGIRDGWTDRLGVRPEFRGRGIARALLARSMQAFAEAGLDAAGLGVDADNPTGAFSLYQSMGYTAGDTVIRYALDTD